MNKFPKDSSLKKVIITKDCIFINVPESAGTTMLGYLGHDLPSGIIPELWPYLELQKLYYFDDIINLMRFLMHLKTTFLRKKLSDLC